MQLILFYYFWCAGHLASYAEQRKFYHEIDKGDIVVYCGFVYYGNRVYDSDRGLEGGNFASFVA